MLLNRDLEVGKNNNKKKNDTKKVGIKNVAWQREGGGFIPAMADILLARQGASEKSRINLTNNM